MSAIIQAAEMSVLKPGDYYRLQFVKGFYSQKFQTDMADYRVRFDNLTEIPPEEYKYSLTRIFDDILEQLTKTMPENKYARFYMDMAALKNPINLPYMEATDLTSHRILEHIEKIQNSNDKVTLNGEDVDLHIICTAKETPGSGWSENGSCRNRIIINLVEWLRIKKGAIQIKNNDKLCLARALVVAKAQYNNTEMGTTDSATYYRKIRHPTRPFQKICAVKLHEDAKVPLQACGLPEINCFQKYLEHQGYRIIVYSAEENFEKMFTGPRSCTKLLHIIKHSNHYDVITKPAALFNTSYYCKSCLTGVDRLDSHACLARCKACRDSNCSTTVKYPAIKCESCRRYFYTDSCLKYHQQNGTCSTIQRCKDCNNQMTKNMHHMCNTYKCTYCFKHVDSGHLCYIQKLNKGNELNSEAESVEALQDHETDFCKSGTKRKFGGLKVAQDFKKAKRLKLQKPVIYYYDIEATQETGIHVANFIAVHREDGLERLFEDSQKHDAKDSFCDWIFKQHCDEPAPTPRIFIAHYGKGYDTYFVLEYIHRHCLYPAVVSTGSKYMLIELPQLNIKFIDSHNFIATALKSFPKMFELHELKKGYFPHLFNTSVNKNYIGPMPPIDTYNPTAMTTPEYLKFIMWYNMQKDAGTIFNMQDELKAYCISDVDILRQGCEKFRSACIETHSLDPFITSITIASYCHKVYRTHYMPENTIGIVPAGGYGRNTKYSTEALQWLKWIMHTENTVIRHARNGGEVKIGAYYLDGCDTALKIAYEFNGCLYHGCPSCYDEDMESPLGAGRMGDLYAKSKKRIEYIEKQGYKTRVIWECDFKKMLKNNSDMAEYIAGVRIMKPLNPRDAFYGGRTDVSKMHHAAEEDEEINYLDFVSLYPTINKYGKMPVGHPVILLPDAGEEYIPGRYYGLVKCKVLPPRHLVHAVLPSKCNGKLIFALCGACMERQQTTICLHTDKERAIMGTWVSPELDVAIEKGYRVQELYEIWHYERTAEYGGTDYPEGLFGKYVNIMLKSKQEASGWPPGVTTDDEKEHYIADYLVKEGILLDKDKISHNPGQRSLAKIMLNSLWGKFGQRSELPKTEYVTSRYRLLELIESKDIEVRDATLVNSEMMMVTYITKVDHQQSSGFASVPIAAFTTALARLKLYGILDVVKDKAIYMDTDSLIYVCKRQNDPLKHMIGSGLGDMTNEIEEGHHITEFVSGGPKNYAYETSNGKQVWKIKGITQNFKTDAKINYAVIKSMVTDKNATKKIVLHDTAIKRNRKTSQLHTVASTKSYGIIYDKGVVDSNLKTWPYGYVVPELSDTM